MADSCQTTVCSDMCMHEYNYIVLISVSLLLM